MGEAEGEREPEKVGEEVLVSVVEGDLGGDWVLLRVMLGDEVVEMVVVVQELKVYVGQEDGGGVKVEEED